MYLLLFLIGFPALAAALLAVVRSEKARGVIVIGAGAIIAAASIATIAVFAGKGVVTFAAESEIVNYVCLAISVVLGLIIIVKSVRYKNWLAGVLGVVSLVGAVVFDLVFAHGLEVPNGLYVDSLSLVMTFIIGVVGVGICIYALGYMHDFQEHAGDDDRQPTFFALMFVFLAAMFAIVFSDNMSWLFVGWETTTVCSFLLIGYTRTEEAIRNSFRQIIMNMIGGLTFLLALFICAIQIGTLSLSEFIAYGVANPSLVVLAVAGLALAGLTKAAQMPFQTWLLGAMVAPTPTSALLHSSTMVKAGVFLLVKLAPVFLVCPVPAVMTVLIGGATFMLCSFAAISQTNAKRVLAYSTIANLGLIAACAGIGTPEAVWAAIFLMLFHACAKSLLFMCVGTAEHHLGSRDIEDMDALFQRMPRLARYMMVGIMGMFIAPFGMLLAKWAALASFADTAHFELLIVLAFGSAATFMFWAKWMGKLAGIAAGENVELTVHTSEWFATSLCLLLTVLATVLLVPISDAFVMPYLNEAYAVFGAGAAIIAAGNFITGDSLWITAIIAGVMFVVLLAGMRKTKQKIVPIYMAGYSADNAARSFKGSLGGEVQATARNWYMDATFGEKRIAPIGEIFCTTIIIAAFVCAVVFGL